MCRRFGGGGAVAALGRRGRVPVTQASGRAHQWWAGTAGVRRVSVRRPPGHPQRMARRVTPQGTECHELRSGEIFTQHLSDDRSNCSMIDQNVQLGEGVVGSGSRGAGRGKVAARWPGSRRAGRGSRSAGWVRPRRGHGVPGGGARGPGEDPGRPGGWRRRAWAGRVRHREERRTRGGVRGSGAVGRPGVTGRGDHRVARWAWARTAPDGPGPAQRARGRAPAR